MYGRSSITDEFCAVKHGLKHESQQYTTPGTLRMEREILAHTRQPITHTGPDPELKQTVEQLAGVR